MKDNNKSSNFLKHIISMISSMAKSKSLAIKTKTDEMRAKVVVFSLLKDKRLSFGGISHKIHALLGGGHQQNQGKKNDNEEVDDEKAIVLYNNTSVGSSDPTHQEAAEETHRYLLEYYGEDRGEDDKYPDLTHSLFDEFEDDDLLGDDPNASVIDLVRNSKEEGEDFKLEDEIDHVADLFIKKFHKRVRMQKLESFKRYQDMLDRSTA